MSGGSVPGGSCSRRLRHALGDELARAVVVGVRLELDRHLRDAELRARPHAPNVRQPGKRDLERNRDGRLEFLGAHRRVLGDDVEDRRREVGKHVAPQLLQPHRADRRARGDEQRREQRRVKRRANHSADQRGRLSGHRARLRPSRPAPSTEMRPRQRWPRRRVRPDNTSTSPPRSRPRPIRRISKCRASFGRNTHHSLRTRCTAATGTREDGGAGVAHRERRARRHARAAAPVAVADVDSNRQRSRIRSTLTADGRDASLEVLAGQAPKTTAGRSLPGGCAPRPARRRGR